MDDDIQLEGASVRRWGRVAGGHRRRGGIGTGGPRRTSSPTKGRADTEFYRKYVTRVAALVRLNRPEGTAHFCRARAETFVAPAEGPAGVRVGIFGRAMERGQRLTGRCS